MRLLASFSPLLIFGANGIFVPRLIAQAFSWAFRRAAFLALVITYDPINLLLGYLGSRHNMNRCLDDAY
jgi:hypothetical protein